MFEMVSTLHHKIDCKKSIVPSVSSIFAQLNFAVLYNVICIISICIYYRFFEIVTKEILMYNNYSIAFTVIYLVGLDKF